MKKTPNMTKEEAITELKYNCRACMGNDFEEPDYCSKHCEIGVAINCIQESIDRSDNIEVN